MCEIPARSGMPSFKHALLVQALRVGAHCRIAEISVTRLLVIRAEPYVGGDAIQAQIALPRTRRVTLGPLGELLAAPRTVLGHREPVEIPGVGSLLPPEQLVGPLHRQSADHAGVGLGQPRFAPLDRRHHPARRKPLGPLLDAARAEPCRSRRQDVEHGVELAWLGSANLHARRRYARLTPGLQR